MRQWSMTSRYEQRPAEEQSGAAWRSASKAFDFESENDRGDAWCWSVTVQCSSATERTATPQPFVANSASTGLCIPRTSLSLSLTLPATHLNAAVASWKKAEAKVTRRVQAPTGKKANMITVIHAARPATAELP